MGAIHVDVTIRNPADTSRCWRGPFLVDTGATDCVVPRQYLEAIGITPGGWRAYELADGRQVQMEVAVAQIEFTDTFVGGTVVFGQAGTEPILGVTVLQSMGVEIDPRNQDLRKLSAVRLKRMGGQALPTFSQAHGYEPMPTMLELEKLDQKARTRIANVLTDHVERCRSRDFVSFVEGDMAVISRDVHVHFNVLPLDQWSNKRDSVAHQFQKEIMTRLFNHVFDLIQFVMRHSKCPRSLIDDMKTAFADSGLAYAIDDSGPPTIVSARK